MKRVLNIAIAMIAVISLFVMIQACGSKSEPTPPPVPKETAPSLSTKPAWEDDWERTVSAAKKEGRVNLYTAYGVDWRRAISEAMAQKYSIALELVTGTSGDVVQRLLSEQRQKVHNADIMTISATRVGPFWQEGFFQPTDKFLVLPEVVDPKVWWRGKLTWLDPEEKTLFGFRDAVTVPWVINTDLVKPGDLKSWNDLLDPKWKGRILMNDPAAGGAGAQNMAVLAYFMKDWDSIIKALLKQQPDIQRDDRLMVEWVARGKYPILISPRNEQVFLFLQMGSPIAYLTPAEGTYTSVGDGSVAMLKNSPNPNAAKVFINFLLSREGQTITTKTMGYQSARVDTPTDHLVPGIARQPGVKYFDTLDKGYQEKEAQLRQEAVRIIEEYLKK